MEAIKFSNLFDIKIEEESKQLPSMYQIPKMHKIQLELDLSSLPKNALQNPSLKLFQIFSKLFTSMWKVFIKKFLFWNKKFLGRSKLLPYFKQPQ